MFFVKIAVSIIVGLGVVVYGIFALYEGSWALQKSVVNHQYDVTKNSQQYQATYVQEIQQGFTQLFSDQRSLTKDDKSGDTTLIGEDNVALAADAGKLCGYGQNINAVTQQTMSATDVSWFQTNCTEGVVAPQSVYFVTTGEPAVGVNP